MAYDKMHPVVTLRSCETYEYAKNTQPVSNLIQVCLILHKLCEIFLSLNKDNLL